MTDLFANHPPPGMALPDVESEIDAIQDRLSYIDHDLIKAPRDQAFYLKAERYEKNKRLAELQSWIDGGLV